MYHASIETLVASGYAFLKSIDDNKTIYESKFTGNRLVYDFSRNVYTVLGD